MFPFLKQDANPYPFNECMKLACKSLGAINATRPLIDSLYLAKCEAWNEHEMVPHTLRKMQPICKWALFIPDFHSEYHSHSIIASRRNENQQLQKCLLNQFVSFYNVWLPHKWTSYAQKQFSGNCAHVCPALKTLWRVQFINLKSVSHKCHWLT